MNVIEIFQINPQLVFEGQNRRSKLLSPLDVPPEQFRQCRHLLMLQKPLLHIVVAPLIFEILLNLIQDKILVIDRSDLTVPIENIFLLL